jgi:hypothetical protein
MKESIERSPYDNRPMILREHLVNFLIRLAVVGMLLLLLAAGASDGSGVAVGLVAGGILAAAGLLFLRYRIALSRLAPIVPSEISGTAEDHRQRRWEPIGRRRAFLRKGRLADTNFHGGNEYFNEDL